MKVLVLGAYGLIGLEICKTLHKAGYSVTGLARSAEYGKTVLPHIEWIGLDLAQMSAPAAWTAHLVGIDAVVNASGALQDKPGEKLADVQSAAIKSLIAACENAEVQKFVQISAPGADEAAQTAFMKTKGEADTALQESRLDWTILKPGLVIAPNAFGGTSLIRSMAAFPMFQPVVYGDRWVQTVSIKDVVDAVDLSLRSPDLSSKSFDLVESTGQPLREVILAVRKWLGFPTPIAVIDVPVALAATMAVFADTAAWFGWRSALRSTALRVLADGISGNSQDWSAATGKTVGTLSRTLSDLPSTVQERVFARVRLVAPLLLVTLSVFWLVSGLVGLAYFDDAVRVIEDDLPTALAKASVLGGSLIDIAIGIALLFRKTVRAACLASVAVSATYLGLGTILTPELWADPLGVFVKVLPAIALALAVASAMEER